MKKKKVRKKNAGHPFKYTKAYYESLVPTREDCMNATAIRIAARHLRNVPDDAQPIFNLIGRDFPINTLGPQAKDALLRIFANKHSTKMAEAAYGGFDDNNCYALAGLLLSNKLCDEQRPRVAWLGQRFIEALARKNYAQVA